MAGSGHRPASGTAYALRHDDAEVQLAAVGASLRCYRHRGRDLVLPYAAEQVRPAYRGATLAPWPNRVVDGTYRFGGERHQLALTEPARGHALHGLVVWQEFEPVEVSAAEVRLAAEVVPQAGYPWRLRVETTYALAADGLRQTVRATNLSDRPAPFGTGPHPYLVAGPGPVDRWSLELPAAGVLLTDARLSPASLVPVTQDRQRFDFRQARTIGATELDHAFTGLGRDAAGLTTVAVRGPSGTGVAMVFDQRCPWVQVHTADLPAGPSDPGHRAGLAVEPMTCAPDGFNRPPGSAGAALVLAPGGSAEASWRITPIED